MIREAPNGSIWVSKGNKPSYQVIIPSRIFELNECYSERDVN